MITQRALIFKDTLLPPLRFVLRGWVASTEAKACHIALTGLGGQGETVQGSFSNFYIPRNQTK